jgi:hypothetical protein
MLRATLGETVPIQVQVSTGQTDLFGQAKVYNISGTLVLTLPLPHIAGGLYGDVHTFTSGGHYTVVYQLFTDVGLSTPSDFDIEAEAIEANSDKTNILRILGLTHDNVRIDSQTYDPQDNLLTSRIRHYDTEANANSGTAAGLLNTWQVVATYNAGVLSDYKVTRS